jgi:hypothetical protein
VAPGERVTFRFVVVAPNTAGTVPFTWGVVEEGVEWKIDDLGIGGVTVLPAEAWADAGTDSAALVSAD